jgi:hypothetical protein
MKRTRASSVRLLVVVVLLAGALVAWSQQAPGAPVAPVPAQLVTAKKVFISNAGVDATSPVDFKRARGPNEPYEQFYVAMKHSGRYELVGAPADADLVLQLRFSAPLNSCETYQPQLTLEILDTKTHFLLWTFTEAVKDVGRHPLFELNANWDKNLKEGIDNLVADLTRLAGQPAVASR